MSKHPRTTSDQLKEVFESALKKLPYYSADSHNRSRAAKHLAELLCTSVVFMDQLGDLNPALDIKWPPAYTVSAGSNWDER
jgi:hypothetical protein